MALPHVFPPVYHSTTLITDQSNTEMKNHLGFGKNDLNMNDIYPFYISGMQSVHTNPYFLI